MAEQDWREWNFIGLQRAVAIISFYLRRFPVFSEGENDHLKAKCSLKLVSYRGFQQRSLSKNL